MIYKIVLFIIILNFNSMKTFLFQLEEGGVGFGSEFHPHEYKIGRKKYTRNKYPRKKSRENNIIS